MGLFTTAIYLIWGGLWTDFLQKEQYCRNKIKMEYCVYSYHALFWPISVIVYFIGRRK